MFGVTRHRGFAKFALWASLLLPASGCSTSVNMYPVEGPVSQERPLPVLVARVDGILGNTGQFDFKSADNAYCSGRWSSVAPQMVSVGWGSLFTTYGSAHGFGTGISSMPGVNKGQAFGVCSDNTTFQVEFLTGSGTANGFGIAKDSRGNVYRLIF